MSPRPALTLGLLAACAAPDARPSVLLVTFDTTRADRLGPYGGDVPTPTWDALAARGLTFERAYSTAPLTTPAHSSMLTGRTPLTHGVRDNGSFVLDDELVTLAERFAGAGWDTLAFTSAFPTAARWNLDQGFAIYDDGEAEEAGPNRWMGSRRGDDTVDAALAALAGVHDPAFVWVHLFDAHFPYEPPASFADVVPGDPYAGEIAWADHQIGRLLDGLPHGEWITVFTADHGEGFGEGGERTHGFLLHDATIRAPLVLAGPGVDPGRSDAVVSHVDLAPTLLTLAGLRLHAGLEGRDLRDGGPDMPGRRRSPGCTPSACGRCTPAPPPPDATPRGDMVRSTPTRGSAWRSPPTAQRT